MNYATAFATRDFDTTEAMSDREVPFDLSSVEDSFTNFDDMDDWTDVVRVPEVDML